VWYEHSAYRGRKGRKCEHGRMGAGRLIMRNDVDKRHRILTINAYIPLPMVWGACDLSTAGTEGEKGENAIMAGTAEGRLATRKVVDKRH